MSLHTHTHALFIYHNKHELRKLSYINTAPVEKLKCSTKNPKQKQDHKLPEQLKAEAVNWQINYRAITT